MKFGSLFAIAMVFAAVFFALTPSVSAQITPGSYQLVGVLNGGGFAGRVDIDAPQAAGQRRVDVRLGRGLVLRGWIVQGNYKVEEVRRGRTRLRATGTLTMRSPNHAIGSVTVKGQGRGVIMLGLL